MNHNPRTTRLVIKCSWRIAQAALTGCLLILAAVAFTDLEMRQWVSASFASLVGIAAASYATHVGEQVRQSVAAAFKAGTIAGRVAHQLELSSAPEPETKRHLHAVSE